MRTRTLAVMGLLLVFLAGCSGSTVKKTTTASPPAKTTSVNTTGAPGNSSAATLEQSVIDAVKKVEPAVVEITVTTPQGTAQGSGSIITADGYILTNYHVIQGGDSISVNTTQGKFTAKVAGIDPADDLAVIKIDGRTDLPVLPFADSSKAQIGQFVIAVGNPLGVGRSASFGIISALNRTVSEAPSGPANVIPNAIQTSAPINPGNSGGALIDLSGNLVGVPTLGALDQEFGGTPANGVGFAIPSNQAKLIADQIIATGKVTNTGRAFLGVRTQDVTPGNASANGISINYGCYVAELVAGAPAQTAGVKVGDVIYQLDGTTISDSTGLATYLASKMPGDVVSVKVKRGNSDVTIKVTLGTLPAQQ